MNETINMEKLSGQSVKNIKNYFTFNVYRFIHVPSPVAQAQIVDEIKIYPKLC